MIELNIPSLDCHDMSNIPRTDEAIKWLNADC